MSEWPLAVNVSAVVVCTAHCTLLLRRLVVICSVLADMLRICERKLSAEVLLTAEKSRESITAIVTRKKDVNNSCSERLDVADDARTSLVEDEDHRTASCRKRFDKFLLVL